MFFLLFLLFSGKGALFVFDYCPINKSIKYYRSFQWLSDGLYDCTWSEVNRNVIWSGSADGYIQIWNIGDEDYCDDLRPVHLIQAHSAIIDSVHWNVVRSDNPSVITASRDFSIKQWDTNNGDLINTFNGHSCIIYECSWSPLISSVFASCSGDGTFSIWNIKHSPNRPCMTIPVTNSEVLSCDWCKYDDHIIACGSSDCLINIFDLRLASKGPFITLFGHQKAIRRVRFSPHYQSLISSISYDFSTKIWDYLAVNPTYHQCIPLPVTHYNHNEFVYGLDFSLHQADLLADYGWDKKFCIFTPQHRASV